MPSDVTGSSIFNQRDGDFEFRRRPGLHEPPPRRRDQPRPAEDAGRAARGDAGAAGDDRGRDAAARPPVPRARDAEPDRVRGHVPAARGAARPLPAAHVGGLPRARGRVAGARRPRASGGRTRSSSTRSSTARRCSRCRQAVEEVHVSEAGRPLHRRRRRRDAQRAVGSGRRVAARLARAAEARRAAARRSTAATS